MQEIDIWRTAKLSKDLHGARAICEATMRVDNAAKDAHLDGLRVWKRVTNAVRALQKNEPTPFDALN
jgi:hypothetical protein